jgi:hypothetical protein
MTKQDHPWPKSSKILNRKECKNWNYDKLSDEVLHSKRKTIQFLFDRKVLKEDRSCEICETPLNLETCSPSVYIEEQFFRCQNKKNKHSYLESLKKGSWFYRSNLNLNEALKIAYYWANCASIKDVHREVHCSRKTAGLFFQFFRELVSSVMMDTVKPIGGPGKIVEIDESKYGKMKHHRVICDMVFLFCLS